MTTTPPDIPPLEPTEEATELGAGLEGHEVPTDLLELYELTELANNTPAGGAA